MSFMIDRTCQKAAFLLGTALMLGTGLVTSDVLNVSATEAVDPAATAQPTDSAVTADPNAVAQPTDPNAVTQPADPNAASDPNATTDTTTTTQPTAPKKQTVVLTEQLKKELDRFITILEEEPLRPNTIYTYKRIVAYLLIYCEKKSYRSINELVSGDIRNFILYLYEQGYFKPTTITSGLSGLKRFLSLHPDIEHFIMELPTRLPRERKIIEIYSETETYAINEILSDGSLSKRDKAICLLLLETGLRAVDVCNIKLSDIDWNKDVIYIKQQKTGMVLNIPLRKSYGNAIVDYILNERPECNSKYLFVRELAPFTRLNGEGSSIRVVLLKMEALAGISNACRISGSRMTRHNAASSMLRSGVPMADISAVLGHTDPNIVSVYLSTDETVMAACTLPLPQEVHTNE